MYDYDQPSNHIDNIVMIVVIMRAIKCGDSSTKLRSIFCFPKASFCGGGGGGGRRGYAALYIVSFIGSKMGIGYI